MSQRILVSPKTEGGAIIARGKNTANDSNLNKQIFKAANRAPKFHTIELVFPDGVRKEMSRAEVEVLVAAAKGETKATGNNLNAADKRAARKTAPKKSKAKAKKSKSRKGQKADRSHVNPKKPGVVAYIVSLLQESVDDGGITVEEAVKKLAKKFPDRRPESMETTFRCQAGRDLVKLGHKVVKQRDGKNVRYCITNKLKSKKDKAE
jgi:hypothetical protein